MSSPSSVTHPSIDVAPPTTSIVVIIVVIIARATLAMSSATNAPRGVNATTTSRSTSTSTSRRRSSTVVRRNTPAGTGAPIGDFENALGVFRLAYDVSKVRRIERECESDEEDE